MLSATNETAAMRNSRTMLVGNAAGMPASRRRQGDPRIGIQRGVQELGQLRGHLVGSLFHQKMSARERRTANRFCPAPPHDERLEEPSGQAGGRPQRQRRTMDAM